MTAVRVNKKWGFINTEGKLIIPATFDEARIFTEGLAAVCIGGQWGFVNSDGHFACGAPTYELAESFSEGLAAVCLRGKWGFIDKSGKLVIPTVYSNKLGFFDGLALVCVPSSDSNQERWGYVNKDGKLAIPAVFEEGRSFTRGRALVKQAGRWGAINRSGKYLVPALYEDYEYDFSNDGLRFSKGAYTFWFDNQGHYLRKTDLRKNDAGAETRTLSPPGSFAFNVAKEWGLITREGQLTWRSSWPEISEMLERRQQAESAQSPQK